MMDGANPENVRWSKLPDAIINAIFMKLPSIFDLIRAGAVCQTWNGRFKRFQYSTLPRQPPMLMIENENHATTRLEFYSLGSLAQDFKFRRFVTLEQDKPRNCHCIGSTLGWLVMEEKPDSIFLFHPFLQDSERIYMPSRTAGFRKVILSDNPTTTADYVVMAIHGEDQKLVFWRNSENVWTEVQDGDADDNDMQDIMYCNNQLYAVNNEGEVSSCDVWANPLVLNHVAQNPKGTSQYLVESGGDVLVVNFVDNFLWQVSKMDPGNSEEPFERRDIPGEALCVGTLSSLSFRVSDFPDCPTASNWVLRGDGGTLEGTLKDNKTTWHEFVDDPDDNQYGFVNRGSEDAVLIEPRL